MYLPFLVQPTASGVFNYSIPLAGDCGTTTVTGTITVIPDTDGDGVADLNDDDDDNDGILDTVEGDDTVDTDDDGIPNNRDLDSDNDGILDSIEAGFTDADNDGEVDGTGVDTDGLVTGGDGYGTPADTDSDTIPDYVDLDSDNDGILDAIEAGFTDADNDGEVDGNGTGVDADGKVIGSDGYGTPANTDSDTIPDHLDPDSDGDGISDVIEAGFTDSDGDGKVDGTGVDSDGLVTGGDGYGTPADTDSDSTPNHLDLDSDNDNVSDANEITNGTDPLLADTDGDTVNDNLDQCPNTPTGDTVDANGCSESQIDTDGDGVYNDADLDDDNDGISDTEEGCSIGGGTSNSSLFINGSFDNIDCDSTTCTGWAILNSPWEQYEGANGTQAPATSDTWDYNHMPGSDSFTYNFNPSSDGEPWVGMTDYPTHNNEYKEGVQQTVTLNAGVTYNITFEQAYIVYDGNTSYDDDSVIELLIDTGTVIPTTVIGNGGVMSPGDDWTTESIRYSATVSGDHTIAFRVRTDLSNASIPYRSYVYLDGVSIKEVLPSCAGQDTDGDGTPDHLDSDSDGDGISDVIEAGFTDADNDGEVDGTGVDTDGLVTGGDGYGTPADTDSDTIPDHLDQCPNTPSGDTVDANGCSDSQTGTDTDGDGINDDADLDDDNDGILDTDEGCNSSSNPDGTNLFTNGSFNGTVAAETVPTPWQNYTGPGGTVSSDTNNLTNTGPGAYEASDTSNLTNSSDGGSWVGMYADGNDPDNIVKEGVQQTVSLESGMNYTIIFEQANFGITAGNNNFNNDAKIEVLIDAGSSIPTTVIGDGGAMAIGTGWNSGSLIYTATVSGIHTIVFRAKYVDGTAGGAYVSLDGARIEKSIIYVDCSGVDTDEDGTPDHLDPDSDGDGISDAIEAGFTDADGDGKVDGTGFDTDGLVTGGDGYGTPADTDTDGTPNHLDLDSDNDNVSDANEVTNGTDPLLADTDGDTVNDNLDQCPNTPTGDTVDANGCSDSQTGTDTDGDGIPDETDLDDDNDGILDTVEGDDTVDTDGDGIPNNKDLDSDNDGILDAVEAGFTDADNDGEVDGTGYDTDGKVTASDGYVTPADTDSDTIQDYVDLDSDNDGILDAVEAGFTDANGDGEVDGTGVDADGKVIGSDGYGTPANTDSDTIPDHLDPDSDGDGISDVIEAGFTDSDGDGKVDGTGVDSDGLVTGGDGYGTPADTDSDSTPNHLDLDSDNDNVSDANEITNGTDPLLADTDGDTVNDNLDQCPNTPTGETVDANGCSESQIDSDGDGVYNDADLDDDNDGILDTVELADTTDRDGDGIPNNRDLDSDGDGILDSVEAGFIDANEDGEVDGTGYDTDGRVTGSDGYGTPADTDSSGTADFLEPAVQNGPLDSDGDGVPNYRDLDDDNDGILDSIEGDNTVDTDGDGTPDYLDIDSDGDGCYDAVEAGFTDANNDGEVDGTDLDPNETTIKAGQSFTYTVTYTVTQQAIDAAGVSNTVSVVGYDSNGDAVSDTIDSPVIDEITQSPSMTVTKTASVTHVGDADVADRVVRADDIIDYTITITNTGNVTLTDLAVVDELTDGAGNDLVMTSDPTNQWTIASLAPGAVQTYTPYYTIGSAAVLTGSISNVVTVTGDTPNGTDDITAISDDPNDTTSGQDPTVVETDLFASITVTKQDQLIDDGDDQSGVGDLIEYTVTVTNTGEVPVTDIELVDTMTAGDGTTSLYLDSPGSHSATDDTPWDLVTLEVGESVTLTGFYIIDTAAFNSGSVINRVVATGKDPDMEDVVADSGDVITSISQSASVLVTKTASPDSGVFAVGDVITYTIKVKNIGNSDLNTLTIVDTLKDLGDQGLVLTTDPVFTSSTDANTTFTSDPNTSVPTLLVGEEVTFTATFAVTQAAIDAGGVKNTVSVTATADDANNTSVADTTDSPVITTITQSPAITVTKTAAVDHGTSSDSETTTGDTIVYTITIANTGNVTLTGIDITDTMTDGDGQSLTLTSPSTFSTYTLAPGATEVIQATYNIDQPAADTGSISNTVSVDGTAPDGTEVSDDLDAPVVVNTTLTPSIEVTKVSTITHSDSDVSVGVGDTINYTITVENTGNTTLTDISVSDIITDKASVGLTLTSGPTYDTSNTATEGTLGVGESATYSATFVITQQAVNAGGVSNTASVTSKDPSGTDVTDSTDSATEDLIPRTAAMSVVKTASVDDNGDVKNGVGDVIQYTVTVTNTGNVTLTDVDLSDELRLGSSTATPEDNTGNDSPAGVNLWTQDQTLLPGESATYVAWYIIDDTAASSGKVINTAIATADTPLTGTDATLSVTSNEAVVDIAPIPSISITKTSEIVQNDTGNTTIDVGDQITYTIVVTNDGNTDLNGLDLTDTLKDLSGENLTLDSDPVLVSATNADTSSVNGYDADGKVIGSDGYGTLADTDNNGIPDYIESGVNVACSITPSNVAVNDYGVEHRSINTSIITGAKFESNGSLASVEIKKSYFEYRFDETIPEVSYAEERDESQLISSSPQHFTSQNSTSNTDTDGDGVYDDADLNDDNDGILDTEEVCAYFFNDTYDIATATFAQQFSVSAEDTDPQGIVFNNDGTKMFVIGNDGDIVYGYHLTTAYDITTATYAEARGFTNYENLPTGIVFNNDGTKMYTIGREFYSTANARYIRQYSLTTAYDLSTATSYPTGSFNVNNEESSPKAMAFNNDGTKMYVLGQTGADVNEYHLTTAFDISTATYAQNFSVADEDLYPEGLAFNSDGTVMFVIGKQVDAVIHYNLTTPFDISTATYTQNFSVADQEVGPTGITFNKAGTKMYIVGAGGVVFEYNLYNPATQTVGINSAINDITLNTTEATGIDSPTGLPDGITASWANNVLTISGTTNRFRSV